jgi:hypothetical protein
MISKDFINYYNSKRQDGQGKFPDKPMLMTLEECWEKWRPYWHRRYEHQTQQKTYPKFVLARYGDQGPYSVDNCRVITNIANTLERDHSKCGVKGSTPHNKGKRLPPGYYTNNGVVTPLGEYPTLRSAAKAYGVHDTTMRNRIDSGNYPGFQWRKIS